MCQCINQSTLDRALVDVSMHQPIDRDADADAAVLNFFPSISTISTMTSSYHAVSLFLIKRPLQMGPQNGRWRQAAVRPGQREPDDAAV